MSRRFLFNFQGANESLNFTSNTQTIGNVYMTGGNVGINTTSPAVTLDVAGTLQATNVQATNLSTGTLQAPSGITVGNINFTGSLYQNGTPYLGSQWTTTSGNVSYTSGSVVSSNLVATNSTVTNVQATNLSTGTLQAPSGITVGNINFTGSLYQNGTPYLGSQWTTTSGNVSYTSGSVVASNLVAINSTVTNVQATNVSAGTLQAPNVQATGLSVGNVAVSGNLSVAGTLTTVNMTTTNLIDINVSAGSANITNATITSLTAATLLNTNAVATNVSSATLNLSTGLTAASAQLTDANVTNITAASGLITNASHTSLTSSNSLLTNANVTTLTAATLLNTNAVSTNVSSATLNLSTGLTAASAQITSLTAATLLNTNAVSTNISSATLNLSTGLTSASAQLTNANVTNITAASGLITNANIISLTAASSQLTDATATNLLATNATITNLLYANVSTGNIIVSGINLGVTSMFSGSFANVQQTQTDALVTGLIFDSTQIGSFVATVSVNIVSTSLLNCVFTLTGNYSASSSWTLYASTVGDTTGITFGINSSGQVLYSSSVPGTFVSGTFRYNVQQMSATASYTYTSPTMGSYSMNTLTINSTTNANGFGSGGNLTVLGGTSLAKDVYIGGNLNMGVSSVFSGSFSASNNVAVADNVTGLAFANANIRSFQATVNVSILVSAGSNLYAVYTLTGNQTDAGWSLYTTNLGDTAGITFTITSAGQVQYTSTNVSNFSSSTFRFNVQQFTNTGTYGTFTGTTQGSYIVDTIQINSTTDSVRGTSNGGLYALGGATVTKAVNILSTANATAVGSGGSLTVLGGAAVSSDLIVGGNITAASLALSGNLSVAGTLTTVNMTTTNLIDTNITAGSANITNATIATARITSNLLALGNSNTLGNLFTTGGNVAIGTASPTANLHVMCGTNVLSSNAPDNGQAEGLNLQSTKSGSSPYTLGIGIDYNSGIAFMNAAGNSSNQPICLNPRGGYVGIGTTSPTATLDVNGSSRFGSLGTAYASIRSFTATLSSGFTGVSAVTINYGVTYSNASKLIIQVTIRGPDSASDTYGHSFRNVGTTSMILNVKRLDTTEAPGVAPTAHITIFELV